MVLDSLPDLAGAQKYGIITDTRMDAHMHGYDKPYILCQRSSNGGWGVKGRGWVARRCGAVLIL